MKWQSKSENVNNCLTKVTFAPLLAETLKNSNLSKAIQNGFRTCGLYPFNPEAVDYTKCVQNVLENLSTEENQVLEVSDFEKVKSAIEKISPQLHEKGIDVNLIVHELTIVHESTMTSVTDK